MARRKAAPNLITAARYETDKRCIRGVRVSESRDRGHDRISEGVQDRKTLKLSEMFGLTPVWAYQEIGISGDAERADLEEAISKIERHEAAWLVVTEVDRLGRDVLDVHNTFARVHAAGGCVLIGEPTLKSTDETAQIVLALLAQLAQSQRVKIARKWHDAQLNAWERGVYPGDVPFGYRNPEKWEIPAESPGHPVLQVDDVAVTRVKAAIRALVDGASWPVAARILGMTTAGTRHLFGNRTLLGEVHWKGRPVVTDAHEALISVADFETINGRRTTSGTAAQNKPTRLGAGTLRCAGCRRALHGRPHQGTFDYYCRNQDCPNRVMRIDGPATDILLRQLAEEAHGGLADVSFQSEDTGGRTVATVDGEINELRVRTRRFAQLLAMDPEDQDLLEAREGLKADLRVLEGERAALIVATASLRTTLMSHEIWEATDIAGRIDAVRSVLDAVFVMPDGAMFSHALGTYTLPLPSKGRSIPDAPYVPVPAVETSATPQEAVL